MAKKNDPSDKDGGSLILRNRKAFHEYEVLESLECGMALFGSEVKSLRNRDVNFAQSYAIVEEGELYLIGMHIAPYKMANIMNHEPERRRKLLAHRREIGKLKRRVAERGLTLVPLKLYWKAGRAKVQLGVVRGKQLHDKREAKREKDRSREAERQAQRYGRR